LTTWFFERKNELENQCSEPVNQEPEQQQQQQQQQQREQKDESMEANPRAGRADRDNRMFSKAIGSVITSQNKPERSSLPRCSSRSRSRSPVRQTSRYESDRHSSRHDDRRQEDRYPRRRDDRYNSKADEDRGRSTPIFSRLGHSATQQSRDQGK
jgi:hypothetical protein